MSKSYYREVMDECQRQLDKEYKTSELMASKTIEEIEINECFVVESKSYGLHCTKYQLIEITKNTIVLRDVDKNGLIQLKGGGSTFIGDKDNVRYITKDFFSKYRIIE